ncbi:hypothetical protein LS77_010320 [Helicobacter bilis]|uniref:Uncharacterized protein n=1 Tax=Helicobacter bilis TaxID=37372 RepID=A0A6D2C6C3_9HELI|nr:hypothetical protein LS77_010320 [Helicobacter bilis]TLE03554.1 hypothetical protein LS76_010280 [Helicobacter bilis]
MSVANTSIESKRDISCLRTRTSKALAHTCKYDKSLESNFGSYLHIEFAHKVSYLTSFILYMR